MCKASQVRVTPHTHTLLLSTRNLRAVTRKGCPGRGHLRAHAREAGDRQRARRSAERAVSPRASAQSVGARQAPIRRRSAAPSLRAGLRHAEPLFARYELQPQPRLSAIPPSQQTRSRSPFSEPRPRVGPATGDGDRTRPPPPGNFRAPHPKGGQRVAFSTSATEWWRALPAGSAARS